MMILLHIFLTNRCALVLELILKGLISGTKTNIWGKGNWVHFQLGVNAFIFISESQYWLTLNP